MATIGTDFLSGMQWSNTLPDWQRDYYSMLLLETLRTKSILVPYCAVKQDYAGANSGVVIYTEVYDTEPNWNPLSEHGHLAARRPHGQPHGPDRAGDPRRYR